MRKHAVAIALVVCAAVAARGEAAPQRYVPRTPLVNGGWGVDMSDSYPAHKPLYVVFSRAGADKLSALGLMRREDSDRVQAVDFRRSVVVGVFLFFPFPRYCPERLTIERVRVHTRRVDVTAKVEMPPENSCMGIPELVGTSLYDVVEIPRRLVLKRTRARHLFLKYESPS
jgi:hypothetical protein